MIESFKDWKAICETKARYCRFLDTKQWDAWADLLTPDIVLDTSEAGGPSPITGREAVLAMVRRSLDMARTAHQVHAPEILIEGDAAQGIWAMQDSIVFKDGRSLVGYGYYTEDYVRRDGAWKIAASKLTRLHVDLKSADWRVPP